MYNGVHRRNSKVRRNEGHETAIVAAVYGVYRKLIQCKIDVVFLLIRYY